MENMLIDWNNQLRSHERGERFVAAQTAESLKREGYSAREAVDLMAADNFDIRVAEQAVACAFEVPEDEVAPEAVREAQLVPTSYRDIKEQVETTLSRLSAKNFVQSLTATEMPLLRVSQKNAASLIRLAEVAKEGDRTAIDQLHRELKPWLEEVMLNAVLASENKAGTVRVASLGSGRDQYDIFMVGNCQVNVREAKCNCQTYMKSSYADFGLACEHLVTAMDAVSPEVRLMRAIKEA